MSCAATPLTAYLVGGRERKGAYRRPEWTHHEAAVILELDLPDGSVRRRLEYETPAEARAGDDASIVFKAGTLSGEELVVCTNTEVITYRAADFVMTGYLSLACFNDLHHVLAQGDGRLLVAVTGLDMVVELSREGEVGREWDVLNEPVWTRFERSRDYRHVLTTKPHRAHPNYVFVRGSEIWVTRFEQRDAICLTAPGRVEIGVERPHDGVVRGDKVYFTTVDGQVVVIDLATRAVVAVHDLNEIVGSDWALGWCRGLAVLDDDRIIVGFSRIRQTRFRQNLRWISKRFGLRRKGAVMPGWVGLFDLRRKLLVWRRDIEDEGLDVVHSVLVPGLSLGTGSDPI